jgi:hypothetical protein
VSASDVYACALALLGIWGIYAARKSVKLSRGWSRRRRLIVLVDCLFVASCLACAAALLIGLFQAWMAASIALSYLLMIPLPCYFQSVNRVRWLRAMRDLLFIAVALFLIAMATGWLPLSLLGL